MHLANPANSMLAHLHKVQNCVVRFI